MRVGLLIMLLIGLGCAGPEVLQHRDLAESHRVPCPPHHLPSERERGTLRTCPSQPVWLGPVGEALSGAATAVRTPKP